MCGSKRRAAAYRGYPPAFGAVDPASGPYYGRRGCGQGRCGPGLIRKLVTKAIENRNKKMVRRRSVSFEHSPPQLRSHARSLLMLRRRRRVSS